VAWNLAYEEESGLVVTGGRATYTGILRKRLAAHSPALAEGFDVRDISAVYRAMHELRSRLESTSAE